MVQSLAQTRTPTNPNSSDLKSDEIILSCQTAKRSDEICKALVGIKNIGDDSVEAIKEYVALGPYEYTALTAANMLATGRLRVRSKSFIHPAARHIYDFRKEEVTIVFEMPF